MKNFKILRGIALLVLATVSAFAQGGRASINGTVTDPTGAVISGAQISAKNIETGQVTTVTTSSGGDYALPFVAIGHYEIKASHPGFAVQTQTGITLSADQAASVNFALQPGQVSTSVEVKAEAVELETTSGAISQVVDQKSIIELPLDGRNPAELVYVAPGAVNGAASTNGAIGLPGSGSGFPNQGQETAASVNGSRMGGVYYMLDGVTHMDNYFQNANPFPNPDATQEFRVITNNFDAQYGYTSGAVVSIATRSGTNQWHGVGFEFLRNNDLNATDFFTHIADPLKRNQFGGSIGGPIKHDKLFIFGNFQQTIEHIAIASSADFVPNTNMLNGDFSQIPVQLHDPQGVPYPNNQIPVSTFSPFSLKLEQGLPQTGDPTGNVVLTGRLQINDGQEFTVRPDYYITEKQRISFRYFWDNFDRPAFSGNGDYLNSDRSALARSNNFGFDYTWTIRPNLVNDFRLGYNRINSTTTPGLVQPDGKPLSPEALGADIPQPDQTFSLLAIGGTWISQTPVVQQRHNWIISDTLSLSKGRHSIVAGVNVTTEYSLEDAAWGADAQMNFSGAVTGNAFSDFLLGDMNNFSQSGGEYNRLHGIEFATFVQDSIKLKPNLTVNLGVRWEPQQAPTYTGNKLPFFSPGQQSTRFPNAPEDLVYAGDAGVPDGGWKTDWGAIEPRLSVAWQPSALPNTSIRAAFGIMSLPYDFSMYNHMGTTAPFSPQFSINYNQVGNCVLNILNPYACYAPTGNVPPFPPFAGPAYTPASNISFVVPVSIGAAFTPGFKMPRDQTWNLSIEHSINDYLFRIAYIGYEMYHLPVQEQLSPALFSTGGATTLLPNFSNVQGYVSWNTQSYNALQISAEKHFSRGFQFISNFAWSKNLDSSAVATASNVGPVGNPYSLQWNRGVSDLSVPEIWNNTVIYQSPSLKSLGSVGSFLLGNWQVSAIWVMHSGEAFSIGGPNGANNSEADIGADRADIVPGVPLNQHQGSKNQWLNEYFNTAAFAPNPPGTFGTSARNLLTGPGFNNLDLGFSKNFPFRERYRVQFRWEMFNALNRTWFSLPDTGLGDAAFGQITSDLNSPRLMQAGLKLYF